MAVSKNQYTVIPTKIRRSVFLFSQIMLLFLLRVLLSSLDNNETGRRLRVCLSIITMDHREISGSDEKIIHHLDITRRVFSFWVAGRVGIGKGRVGLVKTLNPARKS